MSALRILLALLNSGVYLLRRIYGQTFWQEKNVESTQDETSCHRFSLAQILLATEHFNEALVIGKGGFGKVYKGFIFGRPEILAIKRLKPDSKQGACEFWREIETLSKLRHVHLVSLLGYCREGDEMILVYEYMPRGTIADNLYKCGKDGNERIPLNWEQRLRICIDSARGLDYLHTGTQHGIIHRDVKDTNILLDENLVAKISDFGLSKLGKIDELQGEVSINVKGTFGYLDPDYLMTRKPSVKCDVYAFGIVLLVVLSGRPAVERRFFEEPKCLFDCYRECMKKDEMNEIIDPFLQGEISNDSLTRFVEAVGNCLHTRPKKRPTMGQLVVHLEHALEAQLGSGPSMHGEDTVVSQNSPTQSNPSFEFQYAPNPEESIISLPREGNDANKEIQKRETSVEVLESKAKGHKITQKTLWGRPWGSLRYILKPSKKMDLTLPTAPMSSEWKHPIRMFSLEDIKLATEDFSNNFVIGAGVFGVVYKGFINDGTRIVSIMKCWSSTVIAETEVELLSTSCHAHLVPFVGFCNESNELIVVYEYMPQGTLEDHIYRSRTDQACLTWVQRLKICIGAARGLNYLHELGFIHRFVNDVNIMVNEGDFVGKISYFGLSKKQPDFKLSKKRRESETDASIRVMGTNGYLDPSYMINGRLTKASDVYSFGIVLLVVLSGMPAFDSSRPEKHQYVKDQFQKCCKKGNFDEFIDPKLVGGIPSASLEIFLHLIKRCLNKNPKRRLMMAKVVVNLEESLNLLGVDNGREEREAQSTVSQQALQLPDNSSKIISENARRRDLHTLKGHVESVMKLKGMDIETMKQNYTI